MSVYVGFKLGKATKHHAYISEYYCGGCGYPVSDHDSYCPECGGAFRKEDATERIVCCKDCKHFVNPLDYDLKPYCNSPHEGYAIPPNTSKRVKPNGFCAWGERRE